MDRSVLIVGHSHVQCLAAAALKADHDSVEIVSIRRLPSFRSASPESVAAMVLDEAKQKSPDAICFCLQGNEHNIIGLLEHPAPFSIGDSRAGSIPHQQAGRWFVPHSVALDSFRERLHKVPKIAKALLAVFPSAQPIFLMPPPPISDWEHLLEFPGVFEDKLHLGPAPDALRLHLYEMECKVFKEFAAALNAPVIEAAAETLDDRGFLKKGLYANDPSHANPQYGKIMLELVLQGAMKPR